MDDKREEFYNNTNTEMRNMEIDFLKILRSMWHFAWLIILLSIVGASFMYAYSKYFLPPEYTSRASLYIHDKNVISSGNKIYDRDDDGVIAYDQRGGDVATYLKSTYKRTLVSDSTLKMVVDNLKLGYSTGQLRGMIRSNMDDYPYFDIIVTSNNPNEPAMIANELVSVLYDRVSDIVGGSSLTRVDNAAVPGGPSGPNINKNTFIGLFLGFLLSVAIIVLIEFFDNKIYNDEYFAQAYDLSVLATISDFNLTSNKGYGYRKYRKYKYYRYGSRGQGENYEKK